MQGGNIQNEMISAPLSAMTQLSSCWSFKLEKADIVLWRLHTKENLTVKSACSKSYHDPGTPHFIEI